MKKTTLRMTVISACVGAGLALSACGGGGSAEGGDTGEDTAASEEAGAEESGGEDAGGEEAEAAAYTEDDLIAAVQAGGFDTPEESNGTTGDLTGSMADMDVDPAECKIFIDAAATSLDEDEVTAVLGLPTDGSSTFGGATGYEDEASASNLVSTSTDMIDTCGEMTMDAEGMEMTATTTEVDASVDGADQVVATEVTMAWSGQEITMTIIQAQKGSAVISVSSAQGMGAEAASVEDMSATAAEMIAALP